MREIISGNATTFLLFFCTSPLRDFALAHRLARASANPTDIPGPSRLRRGFEIYIYTFFPPQKTCVCSPSCCSSLIFVGDSECFGVLELSSSFALASSRGSGIVLSPRRKNYDFRLATPLDSRGYTRRSPRRRPACLDYVDVDAHRIILVAHSSLYT